MSAATRPPRFGFVTCVQLGLSCIEEILAAGGRLDMLMTLHDSMARKKSGRVYLDDVATRAGIDLVKIRNINDADAVAALEERDLDWLFIIGWSQIAGPQVLQAPRRGVIGIHPTLLPEGRGRASIPWAIIKGLTETGVTMFQLDTGVDTGPVLMQKRLPLDPRETATTLYARVTEAHAVMMREAWPELMANRLVPRPQDDATATYWPGRTPADGLLTPEMTSLEMDRLVRATTRPYPGAFWRDGERLVRVWRGEVAGPTSNPEHFRIPSRDGAFDAIEFEIEASATDAPSPPTAS